MTQTALRINARVLPGRRIEFTAPELTEGENVELIVLKTEHTKPEPPQFKTMLEFLDSLTPIQSTPEEWERMERELQEEKDAWER